MSAYTYRDETGFSKFLVALIVLSALLNSVAVGSSVMLYDMLVAVQKGAEVTDEVANAHEARQLVIGLVQLAAAIFIGIIFLMWVYRMCRNAHSIENAKIEITPGWAVGWYFVPLANLWKPYQAMKETYEAFINRENDSMILPPLVVRLDCGEHHGAGLNPVRSGDRYTGPDYDGGPGHDCY